MLCAIAGNTAGKNLSPIGDKPLQYLNILIIDIAYFFFAETAESLPGLKRKA
jgi:hypothetical protein